MHYQSLMPDPQKTPPEIIFDDTIIAGITPMKKGQPFDEVIDRPHGMKGYIINLTLEGSGQIRDGAEEFTTAPGDLLLFAPKVPHYYHIAAGAQSWYHLWIYFFARPYWVEALNWDCRVHAVERYALPKANIGEFSELFLQVIKRTHSESKVSKLLAVNFLEQMLFRRMELADHQELVQRDSRISLALVYMKDNLSRPELDLKEVANEVHLSPVRLIHLFSAELGISPIKWLNQEKLRTARTLLATTSLSVEEVAERVGFADSSYFFRFFKKQTGMTPLNYRGSMQEQALLQQPA